MKLPLRHDVNQVIEGKKKKLSMTKFLFTEIFLGSTNEKI